MKLSKTLQHHVRIIRAGSLYLDDGCNVKAACAFPVLMTDPLPECNHHLCRAIVFRLTAVPMLHLKV